MTDARIHLLRSSLDPCQPILKVRAAFHTKLHTHCSVKPLEEDERPKSGPHGVPRPPALSSVGSAPMPPPSPLGAPQPPIQPPGGAAAAGGGAAVVPPSPRTQLTPRSSGEIPPSPAQQVCVRFVWSIVACCAAVWCAPQQIAIELPWFQHACPADAKLACINV
jgi:hypothetical protein